MNLFGIIVFVFSICCFAVSRRADGLRKFDKSAALPVRGVAIALVLLGHLCDRVGLGEFSMASPAVAIFFTLSGYGLMKKAPCGFNGFWKACCKLLPIFLVLSVLYAIYLTFVDRFSVAILARNIRAGSSYLPIPFMWYIPAIISFYAIFYASSAIFSRRRSVLLLMVAGICCYWIFTALILKWPFYWWKTCFSFVIGAGYCLVESQVRYQIQRKPWLLLMSGIAFVGLIAITNLGCFHVRFVAEHLVYAVSGLVFVVGAYFVSPPKALSWLGGISYEIYLVHGIFVEEIARLHLATGVYCCLVIGLSLCVAWALNRVRGIW